MDDAGFGGLSEWAYGSMNGGAYFSGASAEGQVFVGFQELSLLAQRAEYRIISEVIATEMVRKWITLKSLDGKDKGAKIKKIEEEFTRLGIRDSFQQCALHDGFFGRGHLYLDLGADFGDREEMASSIGDGTDETASKAKIGKGALKAVRVVEPIWVYPQAYNSTNPLAADWYKPQGWYVMGKPVHNTRLLTFIGREVPDILKPAYAFAGLSMSQMAIPYVNNWLDVRSGVTDLIKSFSVFVLSTSATDILAGGQSQSFLNRLDLFNATRDSRGVMGIDKEKEDFKNVAVPLGTLDHLQAQAQEHMATVSRIPLVKLTGISPSGLNATSEGELQVFAEHIQAFQEDLFRPNLTTVLRIVQLSLFGEVDHAIGFEFGPLVEMTEHEVAELRKLNAETGEVLVRTKAVSYTEERARVIADRDGPYSGLDPKAEVIFPMTESEKATTAAQVATATATLMSEGIIERPQALQELQTSAAVTGFGLSITADIIKEAEADAAAAPDPSELLAAGGAGNGQEADATAEAPKGAAAPPKPPATRGVKPVV
jgi:phage-related protein (TIGR01555 family)